MLPERQPIGADLRAASARSTGYCAPSAMASCSNRILIRVLDRRGSARRSANPVCRSNCCAASASKTTRACARRHGHVNGIAAGMVEYDTTRRARCYVRRAACQCYVQGKNPRSHHPDNSINHRSPCSADAITGWEVACVLRRVLVRRQLTAERDAAHLTRSQVHSTARRSSRTSTLMSLRRLDGADCLSVRT